MTPMISLADLFDGVRRRLRRDTAAAVAFGALCALPAALLFAWVLGLLRPWSRPGFGPLLLDVLAIAAAAVLVRLGMRRWLDGIDESAVATDAERTAGAAEGSVRGALELLRSVPEGTSPALARRATGEIGRELRLPSPVRTAAAPRRDSRARRARHRRGVRPYRWEARGRASRSSWGNTSSRGLRESPSDTRIAGSSW
jgi:hypothetical protein